GTSEHVVHGGDAFVARRTDVQDDGVEILADCPGSEGAAVPLELGELGQFVRDAWFLGESYLKAFVRSCHDRLGLVGEGVPAVHAVGEVAGVERASHRDVVHGSVLPRVVPTAGETNPRKFFFLIEVLNLGQAELAGRIVDGDYAVGEEWVAEDSADFRLGGAADGRQVHDAGLGIAQHGCTDPEFTQAGPGGSDRPARAHAGQEAVAAGEFQFGRQVLADDEVAGAGVHDEIERAFPVYQDGDYWQ